MAPRLRLAVAVLGFFALAGCGSIKEMVMGPGSPVRAGYNTANLIEPIGQQEQDELADVKKLFEYAEKLRKDVPVRPGTPKKSILALSGGGNYGAYSAGILYGWTQRGDRPNFDVVTGISTGALIAPFAFLGPQYDEQMKDFYTTLRKKDLFREQFIRGLLSDAFTNNSRMKRLIDKTFTPEMMLQIACEHGKGRRLYIGTTEMEGRRGVAWDMGAIAVRGTEADLELLRMVVLASASIPGFFPPVDIPVTVDGKPYIEKHIDGGASVAVFFRPPWLPEELRNDPVASSLADSDLYLIMAGKLYADPDPILPFSLAIAGTSVSTLIYSQGRGDLMRLYLASVLTGMRFHLASIPIEYPAPKRSTEFDPEVMTGMFNEGVRQIQCGTAWRRSPPGVEFGETQLTRNSTELRHLCRVPTPPEQPKKRLLDRFFGRRNMPSPSVWPRTPEGMPIPPGPIAR